MISFAISADALDCLLLREIPPTADWAAANVRMPSDSKIRGYFSLPLFPYVRGIFDAIDDTSIERVSLQTAAQLGKTTLCQVALAKIAATNPHPMAWADADQKSAERVIKRTWRLLEGVNGVSHQCPPQRLQASGKIETSTFIVHVAWPKSAASAADYGAFLVVLNETDKMKEHGTSEEADFPLLMAERMKGYLGATLLECSTPTLKNRSYIEKQRLKGDNRSWQVECPFCGHYQTLETGDGKTPGGIRFTRLKNGKLCPQKAEETAWYECCRCVKRIEEHRRAKMMQTGLWVPEGCVVKKGKITGEWARKGKHASFGPLPTLASLLPGISIGRVAREHVEAIVAPPDERKSKRQNYVNSWEGKTFELKPKARTAHEVAKRLSVNVPFRIAPEWSRIITVGSDVGRTGDYLSFYWWVSAWCRVNFPDDNRWGRRGQAIDYGITHGEDEFAKLIAEWQKSGYPLGSVDGPRMKASRVGIDSGEGEISNRIYQFCEGQRNVWPMKGSSTSDGLDLWQPGFQRVNVPAKLLAARKKLGNYDLIYANTERTQSWREDITGGLVKVPEELRAEASPEYPNFYGLPAELCENEEVLDELIADYFSEEGTWDRDGSNEFGDAMRYTLALADQAGTKNGRKWDAFPPQPTLEKSVQNKTKKSKVSTRTAFKTPHGRAFVASQR